MSEKVEKIGLAILFLFVLNSCSKKSNEYDINGNIKTMNYGNATRIDCGYLYEFQYDSCEYVFVKFGYGGGLTHKENCKFCKERKIKQ